MKKRNFKGNWKLKALAMILISVNLATLVVGEKVSFGEVVTGRNARPTSKVNRH